MAMPQNIGPENQILKFAVDVNPDSFAAQDFRTATEKLVSDQAKQAIPKRILEEQGMLEDKDYVWEGPAGEYEKTEIKETIDPETGGVTKERVPVLTPGTKKQQFFEETGTFDFDPVWNPATKTWGPSLAEKASDAKSKIITKSIAEHPRGLVWDEEAKIWKMPETEWMRMLGGWDPVQTGPFRHEGMDYLAGGGMTGIRRPDAVPPKSGPDPQGEGLSYLLNRVRRE